MGPTSEPWLAALTAALDAAPEPVDVFFRDDDGGWEDDRLLALLDLFAELGLPLDVAVIPQALAPAAAVALRRRVRARPQLVGVHQHGFAHANHEVQGRKQEFGPARSLHEQRADMAAGRARLADLLGDAVEPIFTPPWNRCTADTAAAARELGFEVLSREARAPRFELDGLRELPVSLDWFAKRDGARLSLDALGALAAQQVASGAPLGVMLHHAVMDAGDLRAAGELLGVLARHERVRCWRLLELARALPRG
jgi:peptidoglycan/xylan/chitin deacetylase (PgdA/CDA1 family)